MLFALALTVLLWAPAPARGQGDDRLNAAAAVNRARTQRGLGALLSSPVLEQIAQRKADEMAARRSVDAIPADGGAATALLAAAGYPGWRSGLRVAGMLTYASASGFADAIPYFLDSDDAQRILLDRRAREMGLAVAFANGPGGLTAYWALVVGAQPNVLPIFLNDGASATRDPRLAVALTQEDAAPDGEGATAIGHVVDVRLAETPTFDGAVWQPFERLLAFTLSSTAGTHTVYAQLRDGAGRVAISAASINLDPRSEDPAQPVPPGPTAVPQIGLPVAARGTATQVPATPSVAAPPREPEATAAPMVITLSPGSLVATPNLPPAEAAAARRAPAPPTPTPTPAPTPRPPPVIRAGDLDPGALAGLIGLQAVVVGLAARRIARMQRSS